MAKKIDSKEVERYLLKNTDFFLTRESLVSELSFKHDSDGATSLLEMLVFLKSSINVKFEMPPIFNIPAGRFIFLDLSKLHFLSMLKPSHLM